MAYPNSTGDRAPAAVAFAGPELGIITTALQEYVQVCALGAEMVAGRDEPKRRDYLQQAGAVRRLLQRIDSAA